MLMPALVDPTLIEEQMRSVVASASGSASIRFFSPGVMPFSTRAPKPPMKSTPTSFAASSSTRQAATISSRENAAPTVPMGETEMRLLTTGIP